MPFTPFHMGPGLLLKAALGRYFSLTVFGFAQVLTDLEPLARMVTVGEVLHGPSHTYLGAAVLGVASALAGRPVCQRLLDGWAAVASPQRPGWLRGPWTISWSAAVAGAFLGTYSHVLLDSLMHADMHPLWPLAGGNGLLLAVSMETLHVGCLAAGAAGLLGVLAVAALAQRRKPGGG